ncbi:MAG TPA: hypothetical protein VKH83_11795 [Methylomirabilota bacterium]|nr:hypothetical protein [Methylomirabilota bacterium]
MSRLDPATLGRRLDDLLGTGERMIRGVTESGMDTETPGDGRLRDVAFRLFRLGQCYADGMDTARFSDDWRSERAPDDLHDGASVARYAALVRGRLGGWFEGASAREFARIISAPGGPRSGHDLLEQVCADAEAQVERLRAALARTEPA